MRSLVGEVTSYDTNGGVSQPRRILPVVELVQLGTYTTLTEANLVKARLEAEGIAALIQSDDLGSMTPTLNTVRGVQVLVREDDRARAMDSLERMLGTGD
jgi:hypothetical protein